MLKIAAQSKRVVLVCAHTLFLNRMHEVPNKKHFVYI